MEAILHCTKGGHQLVWTILLNNEVHSGRPMREKQFWGLWRVFKRDLSPPDDAVFECGAAVAIDIWLPSGGLWSCLSPMWEMSMKPSLEEAREAITAVHGPHLRGALPLNNSTGYMELWTVCCSSCACWPFVTCMQVPPDSLFWGESFFALHSLELDPVLGILYSSGICFCLRVSFSE